MPKLNTGNLYVIRPVQTALYFFFYYVCFFLFSTPTPNHPNAARPKHKTPRSSYDCMIKVLVAYDSQLIAQCASYIIANRLVIRIIGYMYVQAALANVNICMQMRHTSYIFFKRLPNNRLFIEPRRKK